MPATDCHFQQRYQGCEQVAQKLTNVIKTGFDHVVSTYPRAFFLQNNEKNSRSGLQVNRTELSVKSCHLAHNTFSKVDFGDSCAPRFRLNRIRPGFGCLLASSDTPRSSSRIACFWQYVKSPSVSITMGLDV